MNKNKTTSPSTATPRHLQLQHHVTFNCNTTSSPKILNSQNTKLLTKMLKRFVEDQTPASPSTPTKKGGGILIRKQQTPTKEYSVEILFRPIVDCESKQLLGATRIGLKEKHQWWQTILGMRFAFLQ
jgi:hypothetical protein